MKEFILCAATHFDDGKEYHYQPKGITTGVVLCGYRHPCIFAQLDFASQGALKSVRDRHQEGVYEKSQGFLTNKGRYVEREEALKIALAANQVKDLSDVRGNRLHSEDLY